MAMKQQVAVELSTVITDNSDRDENTVKATGYFYPNQTMDVLTYEETTEDGLTVKNMLTLSYDKVSVKRTGPVSMYQQFRKQALTENVYQHPYGHIHMETFTRSISYQRLTDDENGKLVMSYKLKLNGADERHHQLILTIQPEEDVS
ncbi:hypothetical protein GCM10028778_23410 [Barrientosiimonas marina]|uniref:DUF1934 domain-containing protein n=1 Tax=Lentibacillus kimchii TaxID=1542911 RepID=A0ABW2UYV3_9BACI